MRRGKSSEAQQPWNVQTLQAPRGVISVGGELVAQAPASVVFCVVTDYCNLPKLGGRLEKCEVVEEVDGTTTILRKYHRINFLGAFKGLFKSTYVATKAQEASVFKLNVRLLQSELMKSHEYEMRVLPVSQDASKLVYMNTFQPKKVAPIGPPQKLLFRQAEGDVKTLFENIIKELQLTDARK